MSEELAQLFVDQTNTIASLKRVLINFKKLPKASITIHKTKGRLADLKAHWEKTQLQHNRLCHLTKPEERKPIPYFVHDEFYLAEDAYNEAADHIHETLGKFVQIDTAPVDRSHDSFRDASGATSLQLPRIALPQFSGKLTEWENFRGLFESLIVSNDALSPTQKLHYLKSSVTDEAALLISNIQISDENYDAAWQRLVDEYENLYVIVHAHIRVFADLPVMKSETASDLKRLRDTVAASVSALKALNRPVDSWNDMLVYIVASKFSPRTRNEWNLKRGCSRESPTYADIHKFMTLRVRGLTDYTKARDSNSFSNPSSNKIRSATNNVSAVKCAHCSGNHKLSRCSDFLDKSVEQRSQIVRRMRSCFNCLRSGHSVKNCSNKGTCVHCGRSHHSLLHREAGANANYNDPISIKVSKNSLPANASSAASVSTPASIATATVQSVAASSHGLPNVLLATAWVMIRTKEGRMFKMRALLDQGSTFSFISESLCQSLHTKRHRASLQVHCFGEKYGGIAKTRVPLTLEPCNGQGHAFSLMGYVYQKITSYAVSRTRPVASWPHLQDLTLADPDPSSNHPIHVLLGADLYDSLLLNDLRQGPPGTPTAQRTVFGWILSGPAGTDNFYTAPAPTFHLVATPDTNELLQKFWECEEIPKRPPLSEEDQRCEQHFVATHSRTLQGRYMVRLPFKSDPPLKIRDSLRSASLLYAKLEQRLQRRPEVAKQYHEFLAEYESLGHMERILAASPSCSPLPVHIPHHPVLRESSSTTKLRVVFNASHKTRDGSSLNEHLMVGPKLQQDLPSILLRWRQFYYVYTADIAKMFRQILVHPEDAEYQRILWRPPDCPSVNHYRLRTVTYGLAPAPFLAMRVLRQLALDEGNSHTDALSILQNCIYVDDALFGADEISVLRDVRDQLVALTAKGGFHLRKWAANDENLLQDIPSDQHERAIDHPLKADDSLKILGLT